MKASGLDLCVNCDRVYEDGDPNHNPATIVILLLLLTLYFPSHPPGDIGWSTNSVILLVTLTAIVSGAAVFVYLKPLGGNNKNICQPIREEGGDPFGYTPNTPIECYDKTPVTGTPKLCGGGCIVYIVAGPSKQ